MNIEKIRMQLWVKVAVAATVNKSKSSLTPTEWANIAVRDFDRKFNYKETK